LSVEAVKAKSIENANKRRKFHLATKASLSTANGTQESPSK
jgi:hypothetical protein